MPRQSALAGQIEPIIESFLLSADDLHNIIEHVSAILSAVDLAVLFVFGWLLVPYTRVVYNFINVKSTGVAKDDRKDEGKEENVFENSYVFFVVDHIGQIAKLALLVYACDCVVRITHIMCLHVDV